MHCLYCFSFDVDPEDKVEGIHLAVTGEPSSLYEIRICSSNVSEIWRATTEKKKKGKIKLKESLVFQKPGSRYNALKVYCPPGKKERFVFAWDELSNCLYRLIVKEHRCEVSTKVLHSSEQIPFCLDSGARLWLFDPHLHRLCVSTATVINRANVLFDQVHKFAKHGFCGIWIRSNYITGVSLTPNSILVVSFLKSN